METMLPWARKSMKAAHDARWSAFERFRDAA